MAEAGRTNRGAIRGEAGFSLVEVLVAMFVLVAGVIAVFGIFDASRRNTFRAEQSQVAVSIAQRELEEIRGLAYEDVALTTTPSTSADQGDPRSRVSGNYFDVDPGSASDPAEMAVRGLGEVEGGAVSPGPTPFDVGEISGRIYRFVVWRDDPSCPPATCPGSRDIRRAVVAVRLDSTALGGDRPYVEVQSDFSDPDASTFNTNDPGGGGSILTAQQLFLSDTTCNHSSRQPIVADHPEHRTTETCADPNPDKPDALFDSAPPDAEPEDPAVPAEFDYASDVEPQSGNGDRGLQLLRLPQDGCTYSTGESAQYRLHRWVSQPLAGNFTLSGQATLHLYTRTINGLVGPGRLCIFLFVRTDNQDGTFTDTRLVDSANPPNAYFTYTESPWPTGTWSREQIGMSFAQTTASPGQRIGLGIAVSRSGTSGDYLEFMYDHPDFPSRLEIRTTTPLD